MITSTLHGRLVPFLGAGASSCVLPTGAELVRYLKAYVEYPDPEENDLARVAQYFLVLHGREVVGEWVVELLQKEHEKKRKEHVTSPSHEALARLPVTLYLTTNYDDLMEHALLRVAKQPISLYPIWHTDLQSMSEHVVVGDQPVDEIKPTVERPVVYHLHGHWGIPKSILITEDDYIHFLSALDNPSLLPKVCKQALASDTIVFVGYGLRDWNIRVLLTQRGTKSRTYAIMPRPANAGLATFQEKDLAARFTKVLWGTAQQFTNEFLVRWTVATNIDRLR